MGTTLHIFKNAFEMLHDAVLIVDRQMIIRYANTSSSTLFGYATNEFAGNSIEMLVPEQLTERHQKQTAAYAQKPKPRQMNTGKRLLARKKDGTTLPVSISINPVNADGEALLCAVVRDLSELVRIEAELLQQKKMESLGVLVGGVAHDINNIMTAVRGSIYLARRKPDQCERHLNTIDTQCEYAADIVQQMLVISRDDSIKTEIFSLADSLIKSKRLFRATTSGQTNITFDIATTNAHIKGSTTLLNQAVINLILNARDAVAEVTSPCITLSLTEAGRMDRDDCSAEYLCISVADNGHGMEKYTLDRMFEPFYTTKPSTKGTGLGLAIVYNVAQICGGFVEADSVVGQGTTFRIYLPVVDVAAPACKQQAANSEDHATVDEAGILLVEDNKAVRKVNRDIIESLGYTVYSAKNGCAASKKAMLFEEDIKLIIMDLSMPEMGGVDAALKIRAMGNQLPIIFYSGNSHFFKPLGQHAAALHPFSMLSKPFSIRVLGERIETLLHPTTTQSGRRTAAPAQQ